MAKVLEDHLGRRGHEVSSTYLYGKEGVDRDPTEFVLYTGKPRWYRYPMLLVRVIRRLAIERPDAVITHTHYATMIAQCAAAMCGVRHRIAVKHRIVNVNPVVTRWSDAVYGAVGIYTHNVVVSEAVRKSLAHYPNRYHRTVRVIHNGAAVQDERADDRSVRSELGIGADRHVVINVGRLAPEKNQAAIVKVIQRIPNSIAILIGHGPCKHDLEALAESSGVSDRVLFLGAVPSSEVSRYLRAADIFLFPSKFEAMSVALVEAMHAGLAIVASDLPANREVLGEYGSYVPSDNVDVMVREVSRMLSDPERCRSVGRMALARARSLFSIESMVDHYESLLR